MTTAAHATMPRASAHPAPIRALAARRAQPAPLRLRAGTGRGGTDCSAVPLRAPQAGQLRVGASDDALEREADSMAAQVLAHAPLQAPSQAPRQASRQAPAQLNRACAACEQEEPEVRRSPAAGAPAGIGPAGGVAPPIVGAALAAPGTALAPAERNFFEARFGRDLSAVRIHTDGLAVASARAVNARAYTVGADIVFGAGHYAPDATAGRQLLAHELAHVVQQGQAPGPVLRRSYTEDQAAGCGVCESPQASGQRAHVLTQLAMGAGLRRRVPLRSVMAEVGLSYPESPSDGILDLVRLSRSPSPPFETLIEIGEIKPYNTRGVKQGHADLAHYLFELQHAQVIAGVGRGRVLSGFLEQPPPMIPLAFLDPTSQCAAQAMTVEGPFEGLYLYSCTPPRAALEGECCDQEELARRKARARRQLPEGQQLPGALPQDVPLQGPVDTGRPPPQAEPAPQPIPIGRPRPGRRPEPEAAPEHEPVPIAAYGWDDVLRFFLAVAVAAGATALVRRLLMAASKTRGGGLLVVLEALAAVAVLVLGERQAKAGTAATDDDPLVALAQVLGDTGQPMPPEMEALLREHPELRALIRLEMQRRRRAGGASAPGATAGTGAGTAPVGGGPQAGPQGTAGAAGGTPGQAGTTAATAPARPATATPAVPQREASSEPGPGYWANLQAVLGSPVAQALGADKAEFLWPGGVGPATVRPGQKVIGTHVGHAAAQGLHYAFQLEIEVVSNQAGVVQAKVVWSGPMLLGDGRHLPHAPGFAPGRSFPIRTIAE